MTRFVSTVLILLKPVARTWFNFELGSNLTLNRNMRCTQYGGSRSDYFGSALNRRLTTDKF